MGEAASMMTAPGEMGPSVTVGPPQYVMAPQPQMRQAPAPGQPSVTYAPPIVIQHPAQMHPSPASYVPPPQPQFVSYPPAEPTTVFGTAPQAGEQPSVIVAPPQYVQQMPRDPRESVISYGGQQVTA